MNSMNSWNSTKTFEKTRMEFLRNGAELSLTSVPKWSGTWGTLIMTEAWIELGLKILSLICVFLVLLLHPGLIHQRLLSSSSSPFTVITIFGRWIHWIYWKHLEIDWEAIFLLVTWQFTWLNPVNCWYILLNPLHSVKSLRETTIVQTA